MCLNLNVRCQLLSRSKRRNHTYALKYKLAPIFLREFDYLCLSSSGRSQIQRRGSAKQEYLTDTIVEYYDQPLEGALFFIGNEEAYVKIVKVNR